MRTWFACLVALPLFAVALPGCGAFPGPKRADPSLLYLNLVWHQHQPLYYKDEAGVYTRPWVRVHATKDYVDMASTVAQYPDVHLTFNLTPVLIRQLDDFAENGAKDVYWVLAEKPASELSEQDKLFLLERFFDANWTNVIGRFPRYQQLLNQRGGTSPEAIEAAVRSFTEQDFRDLQVWFNLAWFDPDFLAVEPLRSLVEKGSGFSEADKQVLFEEARRITAEVIPLHRQLQQRGQIEVITSPYAHPILPLLYDTRLALVGNPGADLPERFSFPNDAIAQLQRGVEVYEAHFGRAPRGLWPSEGAVAEEIVPLVADAGYRWMASGEDVLAQSLGIGSFTRDAQDTLQEADDLYRPYFVQGDRGDPVLIMFRDLRLSDLIGFEYSQTPGEQAAADFMQRLENIRRRLEEQGTPGPHLVSVILDGENAWEHYPNDGKEFLHALYRMLSESTSVRAVTPSEYLSFFPEQRELETLFPGAWFSPHFDTWIGEPEEKDAWEYLLQVREDLAKYDLYGRRTPPSEAALQTALDFMYLAQGSDWFWWYGADQDSGNDDYFDQGFRALLGEVYRALGDDVPAFVRVPILPRAPVEPTRGLEGLASPTIDGQVSPEGEWDAAAFYQLGEAQAAAFYYAFDQQNFYLRLDLSPQAAEGLAVEVYIGSPRLGTTQPFQRPRAEGEPELIGFGATTLVEVSRRGGQWRATHFAAARTGWEPADASTAVRVAGEQAVLELALPLALLGELEPGDELRLAAVVTDGERSLQTIPSQGPARAFLPDLGLTTVLLEVADPEGDDHGPGSYTYPTDAVFAAQVFDLETFTVGVDEKNLVFSFTFYGPIPNPWGSPNNLALQTLDVYIDQDPGAGTGARLLLPGRNAALAPGYGWEFAVWAEGWTPALVAPDASGVPKVVGGAEFKILVDPAKRRVTLRVPRSLVGDGDPSSWAFLAVVLSQDGFPSPGAWRVRDVLRQAQQWRLGGGPEDTNHTRILDLVWPADGFPTQQAMLRTYPSTSDPLDRLGPEDFAVLEMLVP